ncbi:hypothetical protein GCM10009855_32750 [Gordonia cholesterolivorans]|uniref:Uncharacterized protein n=1 Tax=Gordonia cholesterolivorans TaxID=559625 RepID=A0ABN3HYQ5_9ACTN
MHAGIRVRHIGAAERIQVANTRGGRVSVRRMKVRRTRVGSGVCVEAFYDARRICAE